MCEVVEEGAQGTHSELQALVFKVCVVLEFIVCPIRVRGYSVNSDDDTRETVQDYAKCDYSN